MLVRFLTFTPDPEQVVAAAARLCCSDASIDELPGQALDQVDWLLLARKVPMSCGAIEEVREEYTELQPALQNV
jgi:hypothetical protein